MFNLDPLVRKMDGEQIKASGKIAAVVLRKADLPAYEKSLTAHGFKIDDPLDMGEGVVILKQSNFDEKNTVPVEISNDVAVLVENVQKAFEPYTESDDFMKVIGTEGFLPSMSSANDALISTMINILMKSDSPEDVQTKMQSALSTYSDYVLTMVKSIPIDAFKLDREKAEGEAEGAEASTEGEGEGEAPAAETAEESTEEATAEGEAEASADPTDTAEAEGEATTEESVTKNEESSDGLAEILKGFKDEVLGKLTSLSEEVGEVRKTQKELGERVDSVESVAKSAQKAVKNTVLSSSDTDEGGRRAAKKSDEADFWGGTALDKIAG